MGAISPSGHPPREVNEGGRRVEESIIPRVLVGKEKGDKKVEEGDS